MNIDLQKPAIDIRAVTKSFSNRDVLNDINLQVKYGEILCICGPNESGKTTLLRSIASLLSIDKGSIKIAELAPDEARQFIGFISHKPLVYPQLSVTANLHMTAKLYCIKNRSKRVKNLIESIKLGSVKDKITSNLSQGMLRRLAIARAFIHNPKILLADEPMAGLDSYAKDIFIKMVNELKQCSGSIILTTHNIGDALNISDRIAVLDEGRIIFKRNIEEIDTDRFKCDYLSYARGDN